MKIPFLSLSDSYNYWGTLNIREDIFFSNGTQCSTLCFPKYLSVLERERERKKMQIVHVGIIYFSTVVLITAGYIGAFDTLHLALTQNQCNTQTY